jgi:eukaryotic-like serine/threonine-protein kinase
MTAPRVLVIDDHQGFRHMVRRQLQAQWPDVRVAEYDPAAESQAPETVAKAGFDIVLLDYQLGEQNGLDYLRSFRTLPDFPPVIMLTGEGNERVAVEAIKLGAADYIPKQTMTHEALINAIREALDARGTVERFKAAEQQQQVPVERRIEIRGLKILRKLAVGGMSSVYLAQRTSGGEEVVLKVFDQRRAERRDEDALQRFSREYDILQSLRHPSIVRIYEQGFTDEYAFIAMELVKGGSLRDRLRENMPAAEVMQYVVAIAETLQTVHEAGVVHRDLKPGNVMFREDGSLVLIDFGLAKTSSERMDLTRTGLMVGTPHYMSPEQVDGHPADVRSDLYALGVILYELLCGCVPYSARTPLAVLYKHKHAPIPVLPASRAGFQPLVERLLAKRPEDRFQSAGEFRVAAAGMAA